MKQNSKEHQLNHRNTSCFHFGTNYDWPGKNVQHFWYSQTKILSHLKLTRIITMFYYPLLVIFSVKLLSLLLFYKACKSDGAHNLSWLIELLFEGKGIFLVLANF